MDDIERFIDNDRFAKHLGIEMLDHGDGTARARMAIHDYHLNSAGTLHGGAIFALADAVFSAASNSHGALALAINVSISFFKAVTGGVLVATAEEVAKSPRLATYLIGIDDETGERVALFQGTVYRKRDAIADVVATVRRT